MGIMYEKGTKVIINPKYEIGDLVCGLEMLNSMIDYHIHTVSDICVRSNGRALDYKLDSGYWFPDICLLPCPLFKIGQRVQIGPELCTKESSDVHFGIVSDMYSFEGKTAVITDVVEDDYEPEKPFEDSCFYRLDIDKGLYSWSSPMFNLNIYDNENQLQREESVNRGRSNREGSVVCGRRFEAAVAVGYLSHKACIGFQEY
jgi:hypothetical protein